MQKNSKKWSFKVIQTMLIAVMVLLLAGRASWAQPAKISGLWWGTISHGTDSFSPTWKFSVLFEQKGTRLTGNVYLEARDVFVRFAMEGQIQGQTIKTTEGEILEEKSAGLSGSWCRNRKMELALVEPNRLEGTWSSNSSGCTNGRVVLTRDQHFLCDDPALPADDPKDPAYHRYLIKSNVICRPSDSPGCTAERVFQIMIATPAAVAPIRSGVPNQRVQHCGVLLLATWPTGVLGYDNRIRTVIDTADRSITNVTLPEHVFYPGRVIRRVVLENNAVVVETIGTGADTEWNRFLNEEAAPFVWKDADNALREAVRKELGKPRQN